MSFTEILELINRALAEENCAFIKLYFLAKRNLRDGKAYHVYKAPISEELNRQLLELIKSSIINQTSNASLIEYNFMGTADETIEYIASDKIVECAKILTALSETQTIKHFTNELDMTKIDFYCFEFIYDNKIIHCFRQFSKMKKLRKNGIIMSIFEDKLISIDENIISIDGQLDIIKLDSQLFILNHIALERIFSFRDFVIENAESMLQKIEENKIIENIDQFKEDCKRDFRRSKWLARISARGGLTILNQNKENIPQIINEINEKCNANLEYINNKFVYSNSEQLTWILGMIGDDCFKKFLSGKVGISIVENELS